ncbi:MAG TPA: M23 family metallopeptidase [Polyangiaceae bacterium]|nr:M23 family metallopeptidase [Polyangiaceae bacterium]
MSSLRPFGLVGCLLPLLVGACGAAESHGLDESGALPEEGTLSSALAAPEEATASDALNISVIAAPRPVATTDEQVHLVYELLLENVSDVSQRITQLDVFAAGRRAPLASFSGDGLQEILFTNGLTGSVEPGAFGLLFVDLALPLDAPLPRRLQHRLERETELEGAVSERGPSVPVVREPAVRVAAPLRGDGFVDVNGCCRVGAHNTALLPAEDGQLFLAQRYAIDFLQQEQGSSFAGDPSDNASYFIFGDDVLAVAGGRIVAASDGVAENVPGQELPPFDLDTAAGNHVVQALGDGRFALYAHLQTGSVRVRVGERVRPGQVLGLVGNTGNSTEPHLHFHVMDRASPLRSNGLPYVFDRFALQGRVELTDEGPVVLPTPGPDRRQNRLPLDLDVLGFR